MNRKAPQNMDALTRDVLRFDRFYAHRLRDLDPGHLSRSLRQMERMKHIVVCGSADDRRKRQVSLTDWGRKAARSLEQFREDRVRRTLEELPRRQQERLVRAMGVITEIFGRDALTNLLERFESRTARGAGRTRTAPDSSP